MARFNEIISNLLGGEVSPKAYGRTELPQYRSSSEELSNVLVYPQGGGGKRPGSQFIGSQVNSTDVIANTRGFPFAASLTEAYNIFIDTTSVIRYHNIVTGAEGTVTINANFVSAVDGLPQYVAYTAAQLPELQYAQSGDIMYIVHPLSPPVYIKRTATNTFELLPFYMTTTPFGSFFVNDVKMWPFRLENTSTITMAASNTTGLSRTLTASADFFNASMAGAMFSLTDGGETATGWAVLKTYLTTTTFTIDILSAFHDTVATLDWEISAWNNYYGWPRTVCFHEGRVVFGGTAAQPDTIWGSQTGNIFNLRNRALVISSASKTTTNTDPYAFTLSSSQANLINWLSPGKTLIIGTQGAEIVAQGAQSILGPLDFSFLPETAYGSAYVQSVRADNSVVFVQRSYQKIRDLVFDFYEDQYVSSDITLYAEHMPRKSLSSRAAFLPPKVIYVAHQEVDNQVTWFLDNNGGLFGVTRNRQEKIQAWHFHFMGGDLGGEPPRIQCIWVAPSANGTHDDLYMIVTRTINSATKTYVEKIGKEFILDDVFNTSTDIEDKMVYMDSCKYSNNSGTPTSVFSGFSHLKGQTVQVVADGSYIGDFVVNASTGAITLPATYTEILAGLKFRAMIKPLNFDIGAIIGSSQGLIKKLDQISLRFVRTIGAMFGPDEDTLDEIEFRDESVPMNDPTPLFTGDMDVRMPADYDRKVTVVVVQDLPLPMSVAAIIAKGVTYD